MICLGACRRYSRLKATITATHARIALSVARGTSINTLKCTILCMMPIHCGHVPLAWNFRQASNNIGGCGNRSCCHQPSLRIAFARTTQQGGTTDSDWIPMTISGHLRHDHCMASQRDSFSVAFPQNMLDCCISSMHWLPELWQPRICIRPAPGSGTAPESHMSRSLKEFTCLKSFG